MARTPKTFLTDAELRIMRVLWKRGASTNVEIVGEIVRPRLARNTVMTTLGVLERKGYVSHTTRGRTFVYAADVHEDAARGSALEHVLRRFFDGSAEKLVVKLLDPEFISGNDRKRIQKLIDESVTE